MASVRSSDPICRWTPINPLTPSRARASPPARVRRRRAGAAIAAALVVIIAVAIIALAGSGGSSPPSGSLPNGGVPVAAPAHASSPAPLGPPHRAGTDPRGVRPTVAPPRRWHRATGGPGTPWRRILMYHVIAPPPAGARSRPCTWTRRVRGADARTAGGRLPPGDARSAARQLDSGARLPAGKPIVITFDNGYRSQYVSALPVLQRLGWVADENLQLTGLPPAQGGTDRRARSRASWTPAGSSTPRA